MRSDDSYFHPWTLFHNLLFLVFLTAGLLAQEAAGPDESVKKSSQLALDEDDFQTVTVENKLGCNVYLKKVEDDSDTINLLPDNDHATLWIPPPRYSDRLNVSDESREPQCYVGIQIVEAKVVGLHCSQIDNSISLNI